MMPVTRRLGLQIMAGAAAAPAAASTIPLVNPDAELIELGRRFVENRGFAMRPVRRPAAWLRSAPTTQRQKMRLRTQWINCE